MSNNQIAFKTYATDVSLIETDPGQIFGIEVNSNPSTGYSWSVETPECIVSLPEIIKPNMSDSRHAIGRSSDMVYPFKSDNTCDGIQTIVMKYARPWEPENNPSIHYIKVKSHSK